MKQQLLFKSLFVLATLLFGSMRMQAQEAYAALSEDNTKLTFYYDNQKEARNGMSVSGITTTTSRGWHNQRTTIQKVEFDSSFDACHSLTTTRYWFCEFNNLTEITGISYLHTENVTDMCGMFKACYKLKSIDVSGFNTGQVQSMYDMFGSCYAIESLNVSNFNTYNVTTMYRMFSSCESLKSIDVSNFNSNYSAITIQPSSMLRTKHGWHRMVSCCVSW